VMSFSPTRSRGRSRTRPESPDRSTSVTVTPHFGFHFLSTSIYSTLVADFEIQEEDRQMKKVAIGCDPNAADLKDIVKKELEELGYEYEDYGSDDPIYANVAIAVAEAVAAGKHDRGILICGTGIGMSITANKVPGAYAALCSNAYSTERSRKSNNANIMTMGSQTIGSQLAKTLVKVWMESEYTPGGRSEPKIQRIYDYAREHHT
jgi:ribose 5-phosphate isomerase B